MVSKPCLGAYWFLTYKIADVAEVKGHISFTIYIFETRKCEKIGTWVKTAGKPQYQEN